MPADHSEHLASVEGTIGICKICTSECYGGEPIFFYGRWLSLKLSSNKYTTYGSKAAGREKSALNVLTSPSLNHPSYRFESFTQLDIYVWAT